MKIITFKFKRPKAESEKPKKTKGQIFENILFRFCVVCFTALIIIQVILFIPSAREKLNLNDTSIGSPLNTEEYLYKQGQLTLTMVGEPDPTVKILVNGDPVAMFENQQMVLNVKNDDVIEIDGTDSLIEHIIKITSISSNIDKNCLEAFSKVSSNIQRLAKVKIKE